MSETPEQRASEAGNLHQGDIFQKCADFTDAQAAKDSGVYPYFRKVEAMIDNQVVVDGRKLIMIGSNNYLGLAADPRVIEASIEATKRLGAGCTGSRFLNGTNVLHEQLEAELADFLDKESVLLFSTGFFANQGALTTLCDEGDFILVDRENHASILDGCQASRAKTVPYSHVSYKSLCRRLKHIPESGGKLVVADGVFSMSGDLVNLPEIVSAAQEHSARVYIDEAHSLGVFGEGGKGAVHHFGLNSQVDVIMGTFSKSLGSMGGFLAGPHYVIDYLRHRARCMIFTASLAPGVTGGVLKAFEIMQAEPERRDQLWKNTHKMHEGFKQIGFDIGTTVSPIVPLLIGSEVKAFAFCQALLDAGIFATPAVFPAVKYGKAIVRTSYTATHTEQELDYVLETCESIGKKLGVFEDLGYVGTAAKKRGGLGAYDFALSNQENAQTVRAATGSTAPTG